MELRLEGKVALVTGASRGIGKAIAGAYAAAGARVMLTSRKIDALQAAAEEIGGDTAVCAANAGDPEAPAAVVAATVERFGPVDILVNNAATNPYYGPALAIDDSRFDKTFQVNLRGPMRWAREVVAGQEARPGVIVNIASVGGLSAEPNLGVYNMTKAALIHLTRGLAAEIAPWRVVAIAPGLVKTDMAAVLVENYGDRLAAALPTGRLGEPADIANLALFLASDAASWITGQTYVIDGGASVASR